MYGIIFLISDCTRFESQSSVVRRCYELVVNVGIAVFQPFKIVLVDSRAWDGLVGNIVFHAVHGCCR